MEGLSEKARTIIMVALDAYASKLRDEGSQTDLIEFVYLVYDEVRRDVSPKAG